MHVFKKKKDFSLIISSNFIAYYCMNGKYFMSCCYMYFHCWTGLNMNLDICITVARQTGYCVRYTQSKHLVESPTHLTYTPFDDLLVQIKKCIYAYKSSSNTIVLIYCLQFHGFIKCFFLHFKMCFLSCLQDEIKTMECYV